MSDTDVVKPLQGTAFYSRKVSDGNYGSHEASLFVQYEQDDPGLAAKLAFCEAKANVLEQLGIAFEYTPEGVIIESPSPETFTSQAQTVPAVERQFGSSDAPEARQGSGPRPAPAPAGGKVKVWSRLTFPDGRKDDRGGPAKLGNPSWLPVAAAELGITDVWDNRKDHPAFGGAAKTKNGKDARNLPWFKEKDGEQAIWPPKDHPDASPTYVHPDFVSDPRSTPAYDEEPF